MQPTIRPFEAREGDALFELYCAALGADWPLSPAVLAWSVADDGRGEEGRHLVATVGDRLVGFAGAQLDAGGEGDGPSGRLTLLLVAPEFRRRGVGTALHDEALRALRGAGARTVGLGGGRTYLWQGVPSNLPEAVAFFRARGWTFLYESHDLAQDLAGYATPDAMRERRRTSDVTTGTATWADADELLAWEEREFPEWAPHYARVAALEDHDDLLAARDGAGRLVGALLLYGPWSHPERMDVRWKALLGADAGALGVVGVSAEARGRGIGTELVARGSEILQDRGAGTGFIGWAASPSFYARLGYRPWRSYLMTE